jgi:hypothetical protein
MLPQKLPPWLMPSHRASTALTVRSLLPFHLPNSKLGTQTDDFTGDYKAPAPPAGGYGTYGKYPAPAGGYGSYGKYNKE